MLNIEMKDFLENEDTSDFSHTRMNIHFREDVYKRQLYLHLPVAARVGLVQQRAGTHTNPDAPKRHRAEMCIRDRHVARGLGDVPHEPPLRPSRADETPGGAAASAPHHPPPEHPASDR